MKYLYIPIFLLLSKLVFIISLNSNRCVAQCIILCHRCWKFNLFFRNLCITLLVILSNNVSTDWIEVLYHLEYAGNLQLLSHSVRLHGSKLFWLKNRKLLSLLTLLRMVVNYSIIWYFSIILLYKNLDSFWSFHCSH